MLHLKTSRACQGEITVIVSDDSILYCAVVFLLFCASLRNVTKNCKLVELFEVKRDEGDERYALTSTLVLKREGKRSVGKPNRRWDEK